MYYAYAHFTARLLDCSFLGDGLSNHIDYNASDSWSASERALLLCT